MRHWAPTRALGRAIVVTAVLVFVGVVLGRPDMVALAGPFAIGVAWGLRRRPTGLPDIEVRLSDEPTAEGSELRTTVQVVNTNAASFDLIVTRLVHSSWIHLRYDDRPYGTDLAAGESTEVSLVGGALRWGRHRVGPASVYAVACDGLLICAQVEAAGGEVKVHPQVPPFAVGAAMPTASALVGGNRSRRPGEGGELAGVRRYSSGDRLRRIDWRVTLRTRAPHIAHTLSDRDAEVVILLDVLHEAGVSGGINGTASVVDTTVRAAAAIAEHYLRHGDRVSLLEYSGQPRHLRSASGRRHLQAILEWLLKTRSAAGAGEPPNGGIAPHLIPASALVVVLTPMLAAKSVEMIATLARAGRVVMAVDTLGTVVPLRAVDTQWTDVAVRLWWMERQHIIGQLREAGVPVTAWGGAGSLDEVLRDMTRMAAAPRVVIR